MGRDQFIGTWKLVSAEYRRANGTTIDYLGKKPSGIVMYDAQGNMSLQLMRSERPVFAVSDRMAGTAEEIRPAFEGYHAYFGTFDVDDGRQIITHNLDGCLFPNWVGAKQSRFFEFSKDRLIFRTPPLMIHGEQVVGYIMWQRAM